MTGAVIPADKWPEWADRHCWDAGGEGYFYGAVQDQFGWWPDSDCSRIPLPPGHDWHVPVMRPSEQAPAIDLRQFRDLIGFACLQAVNLPETDTSRDYIRRCGELLALIDGQAGAVARPALSAIERQAIDGLLDVALQAWWATDDAADDVIEPEGTRRLSSALDKLDQLPDDQPGYVMEVAAKARWALRGLIAGQTAPEPPVNTISDEAVRRLVRAMENTPGDDLVEPNARLCRRLLEAALPPAKGEGVGGE